MIQRSVHGDRYFKLEFFSRYVVPDNFEMEGCKDAERLLHHYDLYSPLYVVQARHSCKTQSFFSHSIGLFPPA